MAALKMPAKSRSLRLAIYLTAALYAVLIFMLFQARWTGGTHTTQDQAKPHLADAAAIDPEPDQVRDLIEDQKRRVQAMSPQAQQQHLETKAAELENVTPESLQTILPLLENALGVKPSARAFEPSDRAVGRFDADSASLYDIIRHEDEKGVRYEFVLVDVAGRTLRYDMPEDQMTPADLRAWKVFDMARGNAKLRMIVDAARRYAESDAGK